MKITLRYFKQALNLEEKTHLRITRIALNILILSNVCLVTSLFFVASKSIVSIALVVTIIGSAILIDRYYK